MHSQSSSETRGEGSVKPESTQSTSSFDEIVKSYHDSKEIRDRLNSCLNTLNKVNNSKTDAAETKELKDFINSITTRNDTSNNNGKKYDVDTAISKLQLMHYLHKEDYLKIMVEYSNLSDIHKKLTELNSKYGNESSEFEEELVEHLKKKFPEQYKLSLEDLKNDGSDDPEMEMTPGRFVDHIGDKSEELLKEYETILKKT